MCVYIYLKLILQLCTFRMQNSIYIYYYTIVYIIKYCCRYQIFVCNVFISIYDYDYTYD